MAAASSDAVAIHARAREPDDGFGVASDAGSASGSAAGSAAGSTAGSAAGSGAKHASMLAVSVAALRHAILLAKSSSSGGGSAAG